MTQQANIQIAKFQIGDSIGFPIINHDIDTPDNLVWMKVRAIEEQNGETAYRLAFPDGTLRYSLVTESQATCYPVRPALPVDVCPCGRPVDPKFDACPNCGTVWLPF